MTDLVLLIQTKLHLIFSGMAWIIISQQLHYCDDVDDDDINNEDDDDDDNNNDNDNEDADDKNDTENDGHHLRTTKLRGPTSKY